MLSVITAVMMVMMAAVSAATPEGQNDAAGQQCRMSDRNDKFDCFHDLFSGNHVKAHALHNGLRERLTTRDA